MERRRVLDGEIGRAKHKEDALAGFERWRKRHPEAAKQRRG